MDIGNALRRAGRDDITMRAIISNVVQETYLEKSGIKISVASVQIRGKKILVKTGKSLINSELSLISADIKNTCLKKLGAMGIILGDDIVLRFV